MSEWLTLDEQQLGDWATDPRSTAQCPTEFLRWVRDQVPTLLNTIASLRQAQGIVPDREGLTHAE